MAAKKKAAPTTDTLRRIAEFRKKAEAIIARIAKDRDALRDLLSDLDSVLDSVEHGLEEFENGKRAFDDGLDAISQYL